MLPRERHEYLLRRLELHESVRARDIAEELDVSQVTIRRDIAALEREGLLARVHGGAFAIRAADRRPSAARMLVGVVVPSATTYFPEVVRGMESVAAALRVRLALGVSDYQPELERARVERLLELGAQGLVIAPTTHRRDPDETTEWMESVPVPVVVMERHLDDSTVVRELDSARTDHIHGALLAVDHLLGLGHRRIALAVFDGTPTARWLRAGYREAVARYGLDEAPVVPLPKGETDARVLSEALDGLVDACLASGTRAVVAHTDHHAASLTEHARCRGLRVPEDLAVVAYDDELAEHAAVPLTAVTAPRRELGREALRLLVGRTGREGRSGPPRHVLLLPRLTVRASSAVPARPEPGARRDAAHTG
ncbi:DNA-binding LacI/PurR family transcriptional regulator [Nocardiopsis sp. Huas11]|uniref:LacI family DNA-binding transcriptional regulator n=1 Tax=Nocardiopsis sp. Huas11 TaxID=2183912 RepID=UPI000EAD420A|nr:substrate-binding domain-containing protein [Nocardiopsis sp. Huas11]RKS07466.1 DNA-binding LacI/PurR family transcriptional regulator [Nocardiopsis sp. Huas11]